MALCNPHLPWADINNKQDQRRLILAARLMVEYAGAEWVGVQENVTGKEPLAEFNDASGTTKALTLSRVSVEAVRNKMKGKNGGESEDGEDN